MSTSPSASLPVSLSTFVGRERESLEVIRLLDTTRLLTLVGIGGIGKTRLALEVARGLVDSYPDGVRLVELTSLADPTGVTDAVATALGLHDVPGQPLEHTLANFIRNKRLLVVLDNCEHQLAASAAIAEMMLKSPETEHVRIIATSRQALGLLGETTWPVPPLGVPDARSGLGTDEIAASEGVRLFCQRAQSVVPNFGLNDLNAAVVSAICQHLDGIPLAIELAAARVRLLTPQQILARLDDRLRLLVGGSRTAPSRHQTLRATLDWSHALLEESERAALRRLAVFIGGWTLEAAEAVGSQPGEAHRDILELLGGLVDRSLVVVDIDTNSLQARYRLLETVRQYALEKLRESGEEAEVRQRHAAWYLGLAERAEPGFERSDQAAWLARIDPEHDNLRTALAWARDADRELGLRSRAQLAIWTMQQDR